MTGETVLQTRLVGLSLYGALLTDTTFREVAFVDIDLACSSTARNHFGAVRSGRADFIECTFEACEFIGFVADNRVS